ncbi:hypothetical protein GEV43_14530 [Actinomadura sp. J1-007]|nr:hypothetical protein [Actinomadura sp. J1-007]
MALAGLWTVPARAGARAVAGPYDFNGDGRRDLAIGSPDGTAAGKRAAGFVSVAYGTGSGFGTRQVVSQTSKAVPGAAEPGDRFGSSLASADFNRDGYADLAVGAPGEDAGGRADAGGVTILWGSRSGLRSATAYGESRTPGARHRFGESLTAGDIEGDGTPELIVTTPGTSTFTWLSFHTGTSSGTRSETRSGTRSEPRPGTRFGTRAETGTKPPATSGAGIRSARDVNESWVASGDVNGDGRGDVVYGWYDFDDPEVGHRRGFTLFTGTAGGRFAKGPTVYTTVHALAVGDFNGDRRADVAVGDSYDRPSTGGRVTVYPGSFLGLGRPSTIDRSTAGVPGQGVNEDDFGAALAVGDANRDGRADLAVGVPKADVGRAPDAGRAYVLFGSPAGLTGRGAQAISQSSPGIPGGAEPYDLFGAQVALLDHNGDGYADLAVGAPGENRDAGSVTVVRGGRGGLSTRGATGLSPRTFGVQSANPRLGTRLPH